MQTGAVVGYFTSPDQIGRQIRNHQVAPLHTCPFFNIAILVAIWHAMFKQLNTGGSFHVKSSDFWPFFHGPPPILLKFGTLVELATEFELALALIFKTGSTLLVHHRQPGGLELDNHCLYDTVNTNHPSSAVPFVFLAG